MNRVLIIILIVLIRSILSAQTQQLSHGEQLKQLLLSTQPAWRPELPTGPEAAFTDEERQKQREAWKTVAHAIRAAAVNQSGTYKIPEGHYRIPPNGDRILRKLKNLAIDASHVTIWFDARHVYGLEFFDCENISIRGLTLDCDPFPHAQAKILSIDKQAQKADLILMPGYVIPKAGERRLIFYKADGSFFGHSPTTGMITQVNTNRFTLSHALLSKLNPNDYVVMSERTGFALNTTGCKDMVFDKLTIYASGGMGVRESGGPGGSIYRNVRMTRRPGTSRLHATGADGFHIVSMEKGPIIENTEVAYLSDDIINLHGYFGRVVKAAHGRQVEVNAPASPFYVGQKIKFWDRLSLRLAGEATVTEIKADKDEYLLTLDSDVKVGMRDLVETFTKVCANFQVRNCWFHDNFNRGFLLNGASPGVIENNLFERIASGNLAIQMETWKYDEGQFVHGLTVKGNHFYGGGIDVNLIGEADGVYSQTPCSDIAIKDNVIVNGSIQVRNVASLVIAGNTVTPPVPKSWVPGVFWENEKYTDRPCAGIYATVVTDADIYGNKVIFTGGGVGDEAVFGNLTRLVKLDHIQQGEAIADANSGWMPRGAQGNLGWSYGYAKAGPVRNGSYSPEMFVPFDHKAGDRWQRSGQKEDLYIAKRSAHPGSNEAVIRRWVSNVSGPLKCEGRLQNNSGGGVHFYVFVNGQKRWEQNVTTREVYSFLVPIGTIRTGETIDLVLDSKGSNAYDVTHVSLRLLKEPLL